MRSQGTEMSVASLSMAHPSSLSRVLVTIALAVLVTGLPVLGHLLGQPIGIAICLVLSVLVANFAGPMLLPVLVFSYLFQNLFVSLVSPQIVDLVDFKTIRGYNFLLTATAWLVIVLHYWTMGRASIAGFAR